MYSRIHSKWLLIRQLLTDVPIPNEIHCIEQIRHSSRMSQLATDEQCPTLGTNCHTEVFFGTIKSLVHALGADSSMTEPTINSTLYTFIEQVNFCDLQKMVLEFAICFVPTLGYTCMVYTLHNQNKTFNTIIQYTFYHKSIKSNKFTSK